MEKKKELLKVLPKRFRDEVERAVTDFDGLQEIRFRINAPLLVYQDGKEFFLENCRLKEESEDPLTVRKPDMDEMLEYISGYSIYAFLEEIKQGFLTLPGGHRVGIAGKTVMEGEKIKTIQHISGLNLRVCHEISGCADEIMSKLYQDGMPCHSLIISPPGCGKTTLLRDCIRQFSDGTLYGKGTAVTVIDERSEIAACYQGIPQNRVGIRTDILDCCRKITGMELAIRALAPGVLALDELGGAEDVKALERVLHCGTRILATIHGENVEEIFQKPYLSNVIKGRWFQRFVVLKKGKAGKLEGIYDEEGRRMM